MAARKRKLHLNWDVDNSVWVVKKAFGFLPHFRNMNDETLRELLVKNEDIDVVLKY